MSKFQSTLAATIMTIGLLGFAVFMAQGEAENQLLRTALVILYCLLIINTFFSVRFFMQITPLRDWRQQLMNTLLLVIYILLATKFDEPLTFVILIALLFSMATVKYILLAWVIQEKLVLQKKILVDAFGTIVSILVVLGVAGGYEILAIFIGGAIFLIADIYVITVKSIYVASNDEARA